MASWVANISGGDMEVTEGKASFKRTGLFHRNAEVEDYCVHYQCNDPPCTPKRRNEM